MELKAAIEEEDGKLPGFTRTCDCMAIYGDSRSKQVYFRGLMMEKIQGYSVAARVTDPTFHNVHYVREMLFQVFSALDTAQRRTGFCHADLGLNNVMEHYPVITSTLMEKQRSQNIDAMREARDEASDSDRKCEETCTPGKDDAWSRTGNDNCKIPPPVCGWSCNVDGSKMPLGPHVACSSPDTLTPSAVTSTDTFSAAVSKRARSPGTRYTFWIFSTASPLPNGTVTCVSQSSSDGLLALYRSATPSAGGV